ncbi:Vegetative incompatibility protein HET-E-1 [Cercospora beticola]|uniref:Vegetative incompatibility protein HET-E-1 n=1 Tax=Cercospora beticola TaxID=122368 RepID=A0A2G5I028_CERBT|nr:Vegetative incompatibility protein HET-E-1 [Cercospora beticola]PIA97863.1 Vegetative incompatibility protein HET-E-1 [Cercospora beticola]WPA99093.1 hypothetical protein RHO25_003708 [Cercospora beticola]
MRLINTTSLQFRDFLGSEIPKYAILSHVWSDSEVSYEEFTAGRKQDGYGYQKIAKTCDFARETYKLEWAWVDTCCIDKRSSAELSEAINSMFAWYSNSAVCLVFLPDVHELPEHEPNHVVQLKDHYKPSPTRKSSFEDVRDTFMRLKVHTDEASFVRSGELVPFAVEEFLASKWFTRGWTLQELIAPYAIDFYNTSFQRIGNCNKSTSVNPQSREIKGLSLHLLVQEATRISLENLLVGRRTLPCIAQRMSWASKRTTTRPEDMAYCLLGLFGVNMPLLYGEGGEKAFERLQLEILSRGTDQSLFMWKPDASQYYRQENFFRHNGFSLLASGPAAFEGCTEAVLENAQNTRGTHVLAQSVFTRTQRGLETKIVLPQGFSPRPGPTFWLLYPLRCKLSATSLSSYLAIYVGVRHEASKVNYADGALHARGAVLLQCDAREERKTIQYVLRDPEFNVESLVAMARSDRSLEDVLSPYHKTWNSLRNLMDLERPKFKLYFPPDAEMGEYLPNT